MFVIAIHFISYISLHPWNCIIFPLAYMLCHFDQEVFHWKKTKMSLLMGVQMNIDHYNILRLILTGRVSVLRSYVYYINPTNPIFTVLFWRTCSCVYCWNHFRLVPTGLATWKTWFLFIHHSKLFKYSLAALLTKLFGAQLWMLNPGIHCCSYIGNGNSSTCSFHPEWLQRYLALSTKKLPHQQKMCASVRGQN